MNKCIIPFCSIDDQITKIREKNIEILDSEVDQSKLWLQKYSYYTLVNGYKNIFLKPKESDLMDGHPKFLSFYICHSIYTDISHLLLKYLIYVESALRTNISYVVARDYSTEEARYLNKNNYIKKTPLGTYGRNRLINDMTDILKCPHKNSYSYYYKVTKNSEVPPWILFMDLEFYKVISLYANLNNNLRTEIQSFFWHDIKIEESEANKIFFNSMNLLREYRNIFAHGKRNFKEKITYSVDLELLSMFYDSSYIDINEFENDQSKSLYSCILLLMAYLADEHMKTRFYSELFILFNDFVDKMGNGTQILEDITIFDVLNLPKDFYKRMKFDEVFK